jgi:GT2 family glycosyltransferase
MNAMAIAIPPCDDPEVTVVVLATGRAPHLLECLRSVAAHAHAVSYEVVLVLNGVAEELASDIARDVTGVRVVRSRVNRGFAGGCNLGVSYGRGRFVVLLNDDALVGPGWLDTLRDALALRPETAAAGSQLLHLDGSLQEAGQILWADGSTSCVGRDLSPGSHPYEWARRVDYCSGSSLMVRREVWDELGGLDESFFPAYCEDVDFCLRIAERGYEVWYEPRSVVRHLESRSTSFRYKKFLIERNREELVRRYPKVLSVRQPAAPTDPEACARAVRQAMGDPCRLLIVDDRIPAHALGAGFPRMYDAAVQLSGSGRCHVAIHPTYSPVGDRTALGRLGVEIVTEPLAEHLGRPGVGYDVVIISRPNNFEASAPVIRAALPGVPIIYDAEALFFSRAQRQAAFAQDPAERSRQRAEAQTTKRLEAQIVADADAVVCVSEDEAAIVRQFPGACSPIVKIPFLAGIEPTESAFEDRADIVIVASWAAGTGSPNADGVRWFLHEVLPMIRQRAPWAVLRITGGAPPEDLLESACYGVEFEGHVPDLRVLYERARVVVVPLRFGSGVKIKTIEALQFRVPLVTTSIGAEGIDQHDTEAICVRDGAEAMADAVCQLLMDRPAWAAAQARIGDLHRAWTQGQAWLPDWNDIIAQTRDNGRRGRRRSFKEVIRAAR